MKVLYDLAARMDCGNVQRLADLDTFIQPVARPDDRDHNARTTAWSFDPNRDRGTIQMPENQVLFETPSSTPGSSSSTRTSRRRATSSRRTRTRRTTRSRTSRST